MDWTQGRNTGEPSRSTPPGGTIPGMNTLSLVLLAAGVLVVVVGLVIVVAGRPDRPDGPDEGGRPVGGAAIAGLVIVALGVVIAVAGGALLALPRDGAVEAAGGSAESTTAAPTTTVFGESGDGDDELASGDRKSTR